MAGSRQALGVAGCQDMPLSAIETPLKLKVVVRVARDSGRIELASLADGNMKCSLLGKRAAS